MGENTDRNVVVASETAETWATELPCAAPHDNVDRPSHAEILRRGSPVTTGTIVVESGHNSRDERRRTIDALDTHASDNDRGHLRAWWVTVIAGAALGTFNSMSNVFGSAYGPFTTTPGQGVLWLEYVSAWLGSAWAWAMFSFTVGWLTRRPRPAVSRAVLGLLVAVLSYYFCDRTLGMTGAVEVSLIVYWSLIALFIAPLMALLGVFARKPNRWSLLAGLAAPIFISYDTLGSPTGPDHIRPWSQWLVLCAAVGLALAFVGRAARLDHRRPALLEPHQDACER